MRADEKKIYSAPGVHEDVILAVVTESEILVMDGDLLAPHIYDLPRTKWVQCTWAGVEPLFKYYNPSRVNFTH